MKRTHFVLFLFSALLLCGFQTFAQAQEPNEVLISIYNVAPGKHLDFPKWQAKVEAVNKEAGVPASQWYVHQNGASWDYIVIGPVLADEQEKKVDEITKQKGMPTGFKANLNFRTFVSSHSDTYARGPVTPSELVKEAE